MSSFDAADRSHSNKVPVFRTMFLEDFGCKSEQGREVRRFQRKSLNSKAIFEVCTFKPQN